MLKDSILFIVCFAILMLIRILSILSYPVRQAFKYGESFLFYLLISYQQSARIFESSDSNNASEYGTFKFVEGNILVTDYKNVSWVVLKCIPRKGYRLYDGRGEPITVGKSDVEDYCKIQDPFSHEMQPRC